MVSLYDDLDDCWCKCMMIRCVLEESIERHESDTPLRRTLKVLLAFVVILCVTVNKMHFRRKDKCLCAEDVELAYSKLNVVQHFLSLLTRHGVIF